MSVPYQGDYDVGANITVWFNAFSSDDPSASVTVTNLADTDIHIYKDDSLTQRTNATGTAVDIDVDGYTGVHKLTIDTSDNTVNDFFEAGHDYAVVVEGITIDAGQVSACVATFSIANRRVAGQMCVSSIEGLTDQSNFTLTTGEASANNDAYNGCTIIVTDQTTKIQKAVGHISDYVGSSRAIVLHAAPLQTAFTMAVGDSVEIIATSAFANLNTIGQTAQTANDNGADINTLVTNVGSPADIDSGGASIAENLKKIADDNGGATFDATTDSLNKIRDNELTTIAADVVNVDGSSIPSTADINAQCDSALSDINLDKLIPTSGTVETDGGNSTTQIKTDLAEASNDHYNGMIILITSGDEAGQARLIDDYVGASGTVSWVKATLGIPADGVTFIILSNSRVDVASVLGTAQTANDNGADINTLITNVGSPANIDSGGATLSDNLKKIADDNGGATFDATTDSLTKIRDNELTTIAADVVNIDGAAMRGTDSAALASVVGALADAAAAGDPTSSDTVMQYVKQLINILIGTTGIVTFPAEGAPANNVSLAEVIRAIHVDVTGVAGSAMRGTDDAALASVCTEARLAELGSTNLPSDIDAIKAKTDNLPGSVPKNVALSNFSFLMVDTDHYTPEIGATVTGTISKDGGSFVALANSVTENANGIYKVDLTQSEMNADIIVLRFTATGADDRLITIITDS